MTAPALIPAAIEVAEGGAGLYALPVIILLQPVMHELSQSLQRKMMRAVLPPLPDPRPLAAQQDSTADTLVCGVKFFVKDHLGNTRITYAPFVEVDSLTGACSVEHFIVSAIDYYPYGKHLRWYFADGHERFQTTEHERDLESGLDYRGARYYDAVYGRFMGGGSAGWGPACAGALWVCEWESG